MGFAVQFAEVTPRPFTVIAGFLGAGKTTLVNRILSQSDGTRYAVLVNDFGAINVDAGLIEKHDGKTLALTNGCICCSMADGFVQTMLQLMADPDAFDHVIVEASGVAEPSKIMDFARLDPQLEPDAIVTLIDAETVTERLEDHRVGAVVAAQIRQGDLLVLNKTDLTDPTPASAQVTRLNPDAPVLEASNANLPLNAVLGSHLHDAEAVRQTSTHPDFHTQLLRSDKPIAKEDFHAWEAALPSCLLRGKGLVVLELQSTHIWQRVGKRGTLVETDPNPDLPSTEIVLIAAQPFDVSDLP